MLYLAGFLAFIASCFKAAATENWWWLAAGFAVIGVMGLFWQFVRQIAGDDIIESAKAIYFLSSLIFNIVFWAAVCGLIGYLIFSWFGVLAGIIIGAVIGALQAGKNL